MPARDTSYPDLGLSYFQHAIKRSGTRFHSFAAQELVPAAFFRPCPTPSVRATCERDERCIEVLKSWRRRAVEQARVYHKRASPVDNTCRLLAPDTEVGKNAGRTAKERDFQVRAHVPGELPALWKSHYFWLAGSQPSCNKAMDTLCTGPQQFSRLRSEKISYYIPELYGKLSSN